MKNGTTGNDRINIETLKTGKIPSRTHLLSSTLNAYQRDSTTAWKNVNYGDNLQELRDI